MLSFLFDSNKKQVSKMQPLVDEINRLEEAIQNLTDSELQAKTLEWKDQLSKLSHSDQKTYLDKILPEAFAVVREAGLRSLGMRHFDVQLLAGISLHQGKITEQKTGEGKTLTATLALYLNSLSGRGVHLVTPNDYLSRHGAGWMGKLYNFLGVSIGVVMEDSGYIYDPTYQNSQFNDEYTVYLRPVSKREAYACDITYGTNHTFGFDYLRDNMVFHSTQMAQRGHYFAIVDEVDAILIDVARTPLIISTPAEKATERYVHASQIVKALAKDTDYEVDEKYKNATLTDLGVRRVEKLLSVKNLYEEDFEMVHLIEQALSARALYEKDKDYVVKDGQVIIVDQFTGRLLPSNRFSEGLHQSIEAKEGVAIQQESRTRAEISYQNYFRMYEKLAGMTGTALTEAEEFYKIYKLDVVEIPTNRPISRIDQNDVIYKTESAKFKAVADEVAVRHAKGQPVLIGTTTVEKSELLHDFLRRKNIPHEILNAKNHEREALIIAQAGHKGAVTVATNMAGRGVDILLGGDPSTSDEQAEVRELGGLHVIGTERHDSRRIDNQLRGRSGRQGDPGSSRFYVSLQDDLMRIFGGAQVEKMMTRFGLEENVPLEAGLVTKSIENAQKKVEGFNFDRRKQLVEMDDVINAHRDVIYKLRSRVLLMGEGQKDHIDWFIGKLEHFSDFSGSHWDENAKKFGENVWMQVISQICLDVIDLLWMEHLVDMDQLREGIGLRGYAQRDPMVEYKREGHERFEILISKVYTTLGERLNRIENIQVRENPPIKEELKKAEYSYSTLESGVSDETAAVGSLSKTRGSKNSRSTGLKVKKVETGQPKIGRNDACPCGSGKKYKQCHGKNS